MKAIIPAILTLTLAAAAVADCPLPDGFHPVAETAVFAPNDVPQPPAGWSLANLWALWCTPCRKELPLLDAFAKAQTEVPVYTLNLADGEAAAQLFHELHITALPLASTADGSILSRLGIVGLPYTALLKDGRIQFAKNGTLQETDFTHIRAFIQCKEKTQ